MYISFSTRELAVTIRLSYVFHGYLLFIYELRKAMATGLVSNKLEAGLTRIGQSHIFGRIGPIHKIDFQGFEDLN